MWSKSQSPAVEQHFIPHLELTWTYSHDVSVFFFLNKPKFSLHFSVILRQKEQPEADSLWGHCVISWSMFPSWQPYPLWKASQSKSGAAWFSDTDLANVTRRGRLDPQMTQPEVFTSLFCIHPSLPLVTHRDLLVPFWVTLGGDYSPANTLCCICNFIAWVLFFVIVFSP